MMSFICWALASACLLPALVLMAQCVAAVLGGRRVLNARPLPGQLGRRPSIGVLIPAHNEEAVLGRTLRSLDPQLAARDRVVVVADNCTDQTARIAAEGGAEVVVRNDDTRRGKGWALDRGRESFVEQPPEVLILIDADTIVEPGALETLGRHAAATGRPVQGNYLMDAEVAAKSTGLVSSFAWLLKNYVRPLGSCVLGMPCLLNGSGMAFPWVIARGAPLAAGHIGEDYLLTADLTLQGQGPVFCPHAVVRGSLPRNRGVATDQRRRWSQAHLESSRKCIPRLVWGALKGLRPAPLLLALDQCVLPLTLLVMLQLVAAALLSIVAVFSPAALAPALLAFASVGICVASVGVAWLRFGRGLLPVGEVLSAPRYVALHAPHYLSFFGRRQASWNAWVKTERDPAAVGEEPPERAAPTTQPRGPR